MLYGFLTAESNDIVAPIHPKAMPVILTTEEDCEPWMRGRRGLKLARSSAPFFPDGVLKIIASGDREDPPPERTDEHQEPLLPL